MDIYKIGSDFTELRNKAEAFINAKSIDDTMPKKQQDFIYAVVSAYLTSIAYDYFKQKDSRLAKLSHDNAIENFSMNESYDMFVDAMHDKPNDRTPRDLMLFIQFMMILNDELHYNNNSLMKEAKEYASQNHGLKTITIGYGKV